ncbi:right-handed parallel beta-helix repeat-containing protein [Psychromonas marina]|uniref:right-handed parallel beta-helix repeat-containing protein n=1 Tax=Psychromonas marina TaxID=88364 RepID=UPI0024E04D8C|nr:right-handed parallel beta-helix repeat-containing protein [Psychromonas marina]
MKLFNSRTIISTAVATVLALNSGLLLAAPGYKGGQDLPLTFSKTILASDHGVVANDGLDDAPAIQAIIDSISIDNSPDNLIRIKLPVGEITIADEVHVDRSGIVIEGQGVDAKTGTHIVINSWKPYTGVAEDGSPTFEKKYWPGFAAFRAETRIKHKKEQKFEGSINYHWKHSIELAQPALAGDTVLVLKAGRAKRFEEGDLIYIGATNDAAFLDLAEVPENMRTKGNIKSGHMRHQISHVTAVDTANNTVTIDKPLDFNMELKNYNKYKSRLMPVTAVENVGFRDFTMTMNQASTDCATNNTDEYDKKTNPKGVGHRYENVCPADAIHGIILKWANNSFVDNVNINMIGSHPVVTEFSKNLTLQNIDIDGSWNKGAGGHGYFRASKLHDSLIKDNDIQNVRHLAIQWSSSGNLIEGNTINADLNMHGGWERNNIIRNNTISVPFAHRSWADGAPSDGSWQPIWFSSGIHASDWAGPTGPNNVFINNTLEKANSADTPITRWGLFDTQGVTYVFGWDGNQFKHPVINGKPIATWNNEIAKGVYDNIPTSAVFVAK